ncbi:type VII toxin-antitoxin system MntA family adenylyltransferase antitoxin [Sutcliffiella horikoshii]|uniref:type VII toxin-antitoxin system MntA family adenylyltransferase antitoxin n=1 Tax=Sutcliffiella horikoshii TaxID=79883 RepID=UPI001CFE1592|nr:nucleotidyltransferase domain-containing protein [Sutcliffiella horikoshii]
MRCGMIYIKLCLDGGIMMVDENIIIDFLVKELSPEVIYLFGSQTTPELTHPGSDVDVAYLSSKKLDHYERYMLAQKLASLINKDVDLVDLTQASTVFQMQIITKGKVIYLSDKKRQALFEMVTYKKYAMLNEERKRILDRVTESGRVYE